ncbi:MAG: RnfABCDGE type electron transport complex subunit G [Acetobacterium sp.]
MANKVKIDWKNVFKLGFILLIIAAVAACLLALTNFATAGTIVQLNEATNKAARQEVLSEATDFEQVPADELAAIGTQIGIADPLELVEAFSGTKGGTLVGYTVKTAPNTGYSGVVQMITGISADGAITGVSVLVNNETPGLGANASLPAFKDQYKEKSALEEVTVVKTKPETGSNAIQAITGATITSRAVTVGVNIASDVYKILSK